MSGGVGVFCPESRAKSIDILISQSIGFRLKLPRYGKIGFFTKKVIAIVFFRFFTRKSRYLEHFTCTFCVTSSNDWSVEINKTSFLKKLMNGKRHD
jgi:hypothetical protein